VGFFKVYAKKRTAAKTKAARLLTYVGRPNNSYEHYIPVHQVMNRKLLAVLAWPKLKGVACHWLV